MQGWQALIQIGSQALEANRNVGLLAFGFASTWMLLWAMAAFVPLFLHWLFRRKHQQVSWAAMRLLQQVLERELKRVRLEQIVLLVTRMLIFLVLALALARPFLTQNTSSGSSLRRAPKLFIIAVDVSYSMEYRDGNQTLLKQAQQRAIDFVQDSQLGDAFALVVLATPSRAVVRKPTFDRARILSEIQQLQAQDVGADLVSGVEQIRMILSESVTAQFDSAATSILLLSDMGQDTWQSAEQNPDILKPLEGVGEFKIVSLAPDNPSNIAVTNIEANALKLQLGEEAKLEIEVTNYDVNTEASTTLELLLNGEVIDSREVRLAASSNARQSFELQLSDEGYQVLTARIAADRLSTDNQRQLIVQVAGETRILLIDDRRHESDVMKLALAVDAVDGSSKPASHLQVTRVISLFELPAEDLSQWDVLIASNLGSLSELQLRQLAGYARDGGSLLFAFGNRTPVSRFKELPGIQSVLGYEFVGISTVDDWRLDPLEYASPVVKPFEGFPDTGLLTTPIFRHLQIAEQSADLQVDVGIVGSSPLLVRNPVGSGWVASLLSAPSSRIRQALDAEDEDDWNALASWPSFLPLMQQTVKAMLATQVQSQNILASQVMQGIIPAEASVDGTIEIVLPDGTERQIQVDRSKANRASWYFTKTMTAGVYKVQASAGRSLPFAVNLDPIQSSMQETSLTNIRRKSSSTPSQAPTANTGGSQSDWLVPALLWFLFALIIAESLIARHIGRRVAA